MRNRWLLIATVIFSVLLHVGLYLVVVTAGPYTQRPPKEDPIFVNMVNSLPSDRQTPGKVIDRPLPANDQRPDRAKVLSHRDNRVDKQTHRRDVPINDSSRQVGHQGKARQPGSDRGSKGFSRSGDRGTKDTPGSGSGDRAKSTQDLISSVSYKNLPKGSPGSEASGGGNLSPYNPEIGSPGDAININTKSFKYMSYFSAIKEKIEWAWVYPQAAQQSGQQGMLTLTFTILRNGHLQNVELVNSSGFRLLDRAAMQAVRDAADYPPMPDKWEDEELTILANFQYRLVGSKYVF